MFPPYPLPSTKTCLLLYYVILFMVFPPPEPLPDPFKSKGHLKYFKHSNVIKNCSYHLAFTSCYFACVSLIEVKLCLQTVNDKQYPQEKDKSSSTCQRCLTVNVQDTHKEECSKLLFQLKWPLVLINKYQEAGSAWYSGVGILAHWNLTWVDLIFSSILLRVHSQVTIVNTLSLLFSQCCRHHRRCVIVDTHTVLGQNFYKINVNLGKRKQPVIFYSLSNRNFGQPKKQFGLTYGDICSVFSQLCPWNQKWDFISSITQPSERLCKIRH